MSKVSTKSIINNFTWRLMERIGAQGVTFVVSIILARLLNPSVYGSVAILLIFTTIMQAFVDSGLGSALIQKKDEKKNFLNNIFRETYAC